MANKYVVISKYNGLLSVQELNSGIRYVWNQIGDRLDLTEDQLRSILNTPGGRYTLENHVAIEDPAIVKKLGINAEPEYFYTEEDIKKLLLEGSEDQLRDALDFSPEGTKELIAETAVKIQLADRNKVAIITASTGRNIENQINIFREVNENAKATPTRGRRAAALKPAELNSAK